MIHTSPVTPLLDRSKVLSRTIASPATTRNTKTAADALARSRRTQRSQQANENQDEQPHSHATPVEADGSDQPTMPKQNAHTSDNSEPLAATPEPAAAADSTQAGVSEQDLVRVFKLLADETRVKILLYLQREGELHVSALCDRLSQSQPAVSHHLALLRDADLIRPRRAGKHNYYSVRREHFATVIGGLFQNIVDEPLADEQAAVKPAAQV